MGRYTLAVLGGIGAVHGVLLYLTGRHFLHTAFGRDVVPAGVFHGTVVTLVGAMLAVLAVASVSMKLAVQLQLHEM